MFPKQAILPIGLLVLWGLVCRDWYVCQIKKACPDSVVQAAVPTDTTEAASEKPDDRPLVFHWGQASPELRDNFPAYRDSLLQSLPEGHILEIIGLYSKDEPVPENAPNLGMARAEEIKKLFAEFLPEERLLVSSRLVSEASDARTEAFAGVLFNTIEPTEEEKVEIVEVEDRVIIHFPFSKAVREPDPKVDEYLDKLAARLQQTDETVSIVGHTDNIGDEASNQELGLARARHIRDVLVSKGISADRITISSKGESEPIADNDSEAGRRRNRRAVLQLHKKE